MLETMSTKLILGAGAALILLVLKWVDKNNIKEIKDSITAGVSSFGPHTERTRRIEEQMKTVAQLSELMLKSQQELTRLTGIVASTQKVVIRLLEKHGDSLVEHDKNSSDQYHSIREVIKDENRSR